jgi:hypothetical protein
MGSSTFEPASDATTLFKCTAAAAASVAASAACFVRAWWGAEQQQQCQQTAAGAEAPFQMVVRMDIPPGKEGLFNEVYNEHCGFLRAVPGVLGIRRFRTVGYDFTVGGKTRRVDPAPTQANLSVRSCTRAALPPAPVGLPSYPAPLSHACVGCILGPMHTCVVLRSCWCVHACCCYSTPQNAHDRINVADVAVFYLTSPAVPCSPEWAAACEKGRWATQIRPHTCNRKPAPGGSTMWQEIDSSAGP